jgi:magnesium transporter
MLYLSQVLGATVEDQQQARIGKLVDMLLPEAQMGTAAYPSALLVAGEEGLPWRVPPAALERHEAVLRLRVPLSELTRQAGAGGQEVSLVRDVLDKQVIDIERKKPVRVNDLYLDDDWHVRGVDNSNLGLLRRLAPHWLLGARSQHVPATLIPWEHIELLGRQPAPALPTAPGERRSRTPSGQLAELHPADIADIVHQLTPGEGARIIESLDTETAADTMEEIDTERQRSILENLPVERAADILETMGPDEAADLLAQLSEERAQQLLSLMQPEESEELQELLSYEEDTAGGLMTTDYIALNQTHTVAEALEAVRTNIREHDVRIAYIYCVADETAEEYQLLGVVSLWELLVAEPTQTLADLMETDIITVSADEDPREVAEIMAKYNLLAVPVVSAGGMLEGVVTVDDALDVLLPPEKRHRQTRMY